MFARTNKASKAGSKIIGDVNKCGNETENAFSRISEIMVSIENYRVICLCVHFTLLVFLCFCLSLDPTLLYLISKFQAYCF